MHRMAYSFNTKKYQRLLFATIALVAIVAIALYSYFIDSTHYELAPKCLFLKLTGFKCPGCGTQRALHSLMHLDIAGVARYNPLLYAAIPYLMLLSYLEFLGGNKRNPKLSNTVYSPKAIMAAFYIIVAYWVLRNVFGF